MSEPWTSDDYYFMKLAFEEAEDGRQKDEVPIGAVLVLDGQLIARGFNCPITEHDPSAHAEIRALRSAGRWLHNYRMNGTTLYVTLEPCLMCFGALLHARVQRVIFGASDPKVGVSALLPTLEHARLNHRIALSGGLLEEECRAQLQSFFQSRRKN